MENSVRACLLSCSNIVALTSFTAMADLNQESERYGCKATIAVENRQVLAWLLEE